MKNLKTRRIISLFVCIGIILAGSAFAIENFDNLELDVYSSEVTIEFDATETHEESRERWILQTLCTRDGETVYFRDGTMYLGNRGVCYYLIPNGCTIQEIWHSTVGTCWICGAVYYDAPSNHFSGWQHSRHNFDKVCPY